MELEEAVRNMGNGHRAGEDGERLHIPFDRDLIYEMNSERYELMKTRQLQFSHPSGTHDDSL